MNKLRLMFWIILFFTVSSAFSQSINQCCILMNIEENGKVLNDQYEIWDLKFYPGDQYFSVNVSSFVLMDKKWFLYNWNHEAKKITSKGNGIYEIICNGRLNNFDMRIILTENEFNRVKDLVAYLPVGYDGTENRKYILNNKTKSIKIESLYNSAYSN